MYIYILVKGVSNSFPPKVWDDKFLSTYPLKFFPPQRYGMVSKYYPLNG